MVQLLKKKKIQPSNYCPLFLTNKQHSYGMNTY